MARHKELRNIASGLFGSFISRNNDIGGYWGIGKLALHASIKDTHVVQIDLLSKSIQPEAPDFSRLVERYAAMLVRHLASKGIPNNWITAASITLDFKPQPPQGKHIPIYTWGTLFKLLVVITDDNSKVHTITGYGYCAPHNPNKEYKSAGPERF